MESDPIRRAEEILREVEVDVAAEVVKSHAEMTLLTAVGHKNIIASGFLATASTQSIEYMSGYLVAIGLTTRSWCRVLADDADLDLTKYLEPDGCSEDYAHLLCEQILNVQTIADASKIRGEIQAYRLGGNSDSWLNTMGHTVAVFATLVRDVLDIRNGDFPGTSDDR